MVLFGVVTVDLRLLLQRGEVSFQGELRINFRLKLPHLEKLSFGFHGVRFVVSSYGDRLFNMIDGIFMRVVSLLLFQ